jgi:mannobiose 2-epimerase
MVWNYSGLNLYDGCKEGLASDGGLWYEYEKKSKHFIKEKHWWPQAEAMIGFLMLMK